MSVITCVEDLPVLAKKRVPKAFADYANSGSCTEFAYRTNSDNGSPSMATRAGPTAL